MVRFVVALLAGFAAAGLAGVAFGAVGAGAPLRRAAQRAFMDAASFARPSGVNPPFFLGAAAGAVSFAAGAVPFTLAQRARVEAAIFARASGDKVLRPGLPAGFEEAFAAGAGEAPPRMAANSACSSSIFWEISRARLSCVMDGVLWTWPYV